MTPEQKASRLMMVVNKRVKQAVHRVIQESGNLSFAVASAEAWDRYHPDDGVGGFSQNPHKSDAESARRRYREAQQFLSDWQEIQGYCMEKFITESVDTPKETP